MACTLVNDFTLVFGSGLPEPNYHYHSILHVHFRSAPASVPGAVVPGIATLTDARLLYYYLDQPETYCNNEAYIYDAASFLFAMLSLRREILGRSARFEYNLRCACQTTGLYCGAKFSLEGATPMNTWNISESAARLHQQSLVADMTMPMAPGGRFSRFFHTLDAMRRSGVKYVTLTVASDYTGTKEAVRNIRLVRFLLLGRLGKIRFVRGVEDITQAARQGKLAVGLHFQGTAPVGDNLAMVEKFYQRGIRHMLIAYNAKNLAGYGCHEAEDNGLTPLGGAFQVVHLPKDLPHSQAKGGPGVNSTVEGSSHLRSPEEYSPVLFSKRRWLNRQRRCLSWRRACQTSRRLDGAIGALTANTAPRRQTVSQVPQAVQRSARMRACLFSIRMACCGQALAHRPQPLQRSGWMR